MKKQNLRSTEEKEEEEEDMEEDKEVKKEEEKKKEEEDPDKIKPVVFIGLFITALFCLGKYRYLSSPP